MSETKSCQNCKNQFTIEPEDFLFYEKIKVPPPTWCPECRLLRRFSFRHAWGLYRVRDARTGKEIFSGMPAHSGFAIYDHDYWWSDAWDPMGYGRDYDFSRPFLEQFHELMREVPWPSRDIIDLVNSDYSDKASYLKNCYLCFNTGATEDSAYVMSSWNVKNSYDINEGDALELCYQCQEVGNSYKTFFSLYCDQTNGLWFSRDCTGCTDCFGCVNLRNKQYYIFNQPYNKEEYFAKLKEFDLSSFANFSRIAKNVKEMWARNPYKYFHGVQNLNVSGDCLHNAKNTHSSYQVGDIENSKFCFNANIGIRESYDYTTWGENVELMYETMESGLNCRNVKFGAHCWPAVQDTEYSIHCGSSSNLFGCFGLRKKSNCILNKQYSPEEYTVLRAKIIQHMNEMPYRDELGRIYTYGEFFPSEFSWYSYSETIAQDFFPLSKDEAIKRGYRWVEPETKEIKTTIDAVNLPDRIDTVDASVLNETIACGTCRKAYRIIASELHFLKENHIPLPRICWECRHAERLSWVNPPRLYSSVCHCAGAKSKNGVYQNLSSHIHGEGACANEFLTAHAPEKQKIVYCETCYQEEVL